jgi:hypothetical protein
MVYELLINKNKLTGTCYFEFLPGKYQSKCWNDFSVFLSEEAIFVIEDLLKKSNKKYDHYNFTFYNKDKINILENELLKRLIEIKSTENYKIVEDYFVKEYYKELNENIKNNKCEIIEMLNGLINWIKINKEDGITILGI